MVFALRFADASDQLGDLDRVARIVKLNGYVQCVDGYTGQPTVINGASDLLAEVRCVLCGGRTPTFGTPLQPTHTHPICVCACYVLRVGNVKPFLESDLWVGTAVPTGWTVVIYMWMSVFFPRLLKELLLLCVGHYSFGTTICCL